jgi:hypothetical protein
MRAALNLAEDLPRSESATLSMPHALPKGSVSQHDLGKTCECTSAYLVTSCMALASVATLCEEMPAIEIRPSWVK